MTEAEQNQIFDISYEMRGLAATLLAASRGDLQDPDRIVEYAAAKSTDLPTISRHALQENLSTPTSALMALRLADVFDVWRLLCDMIKDPQVARKARKEVLKRKGTAYALPATSHCSRLLERF